MSIPDTYIRYCIQCGRRWTTTDNMLWRATNRLCPTCIAQLPTQAYR